MHTEEKLAYGADSHAEHQLISFRFSQLQVTHE